MGRFCFSPAYRVALPLMLCMVAAIIIPPLLATQPPALAAFLGYYSFSFVCHQENDRVFHLHGAALPVCARCCGIYLGSLAMLLAFGLLRRTDPAVPARLWLLLILAPMGLDVLARNLGWHAGQPDLLLRATTGFIAGGGITLYLIPLLNRAWREITSSTQGELSWLRALLSAR